MGSAPGEPGAAGEEGPVGARGPGGIIWLETLDLRNSVANSEAQFAFVGQTVTARFDVLTTAQVTASLDFTSRDGRKIEAAFGVATVIFGQAERIRPS